MREEHELKPSDSPAWMTVRDYYALQIVNGMLAGKSVALPFSEGWEQSMERSCRVAYRIADAMLAARTAKPEG